MWNVTSMNYKTGDIMEHLMDRKPTMIFLSETWLQSDNNDVTSSIKDYGYVLIHNRRKNREKIIGGGVGILLKDNVKHKHVKCKHYSSF